MINAYSADTYLKKKPTLDIYSSYACNLWESKAADEEQIRKCRQGICNENVCSNKAFEQSIKFRTKYDKTFEQGIHS